MRTLTALIHGDAGVGKSWLADSAPEPRLILDAEGGSVHLRSRPVKWNPALYAPPGVEGCEPGQEQITAATAVTIRSFEELKRVHQWLDSGRHVFQSVVMDSLTEIQKQCMDAITGRASPQQQDWGQVLADMELLIRDYRNLVRHPTNPVQCVLFTALTSEKGGKQRAHVQGQLATTLPGLVDLVGYMATTLGADGVSVARYVQIQPTPLVVAKDRTHDLTLHYGPYIWLGPDGGPPNVQEMLTVLNSNGGT